MRFAKIPLAVKLGFIALGLLSVVLVYTIAIEPGRLTERKVAVGGWSQSPLRIVFIADLHAGSLHINESYLVKLTERINGSKPDLVLLGGDLLINGVLGGRWMAIEKVMESFKSLKPRLGTYAVLGNHDWWNDGPHVRAALEAGGIQVLENAAVRIEHRANEFLWLVGVGDSTTHHEDIPKAYSSIDTKDPVILFTHDPAALLDRKESYFLALAGHLHGGQVYLPFIGATVTPGRAPRQWAKGFTQLPGGRMFVSQGIGTSIIPVRFNAPPEFVVLDLHP